MAWSLLVDAPGSSLAGLTALNGTWTTDGSAIRSEGTNALWTYLRLTASAETAVAVEYEFRFQDPPTWATYRLAGIIAQADAHPDWGNEVRQGYDAATNTWKTSTETHAAGSTTAFDVAALTAGVWHAVKWVTLDGTAQSWDINAESFSHPASKSSDTTKSNVYLGNYYADTSFRNIKVWSSAASEGAPPWDDTSVAGSLSVVLPW